MTLEEKIASLVMGLWPDRVSAQDNGGSESNLSALFLHWTYVEFSELARLSAELVNRIESLKQGRRLGYEVKADRAFGGAWQLQLVIYADTAWLNASMLLSIWSAECKRSMAEERAVPADIPRVCSWCRRLEDRETGEWMDNTLPAETKATHVKCPDCYDKEEETDDEQLHELECGDWGDQ